MLRFVKGGLVLLAAAMPIGAMAQDDVVTLVLDGVAPTYAEKGYTAPGWQQFGALPQGGTAEFQVTLQGGSDYHVIAACDHQCSNIDLVLLDSKGAEVASDELEDDSPIVNTSMAGTYTVRITMKTCESARCKFGMREFRKK